LPSIPGGERRPVPTLEISVALPVAAGGNACESLCHVNRERFGL